MKYLYLVVSHISPYRRFIPNERLYCLFLVSRQTLVALSKKTTSKSLVFLLKRKIGTRYFVYEQLSFVNSLKNVTSFELSIFFFLKYAPNERRKNFIRFCVGVKKEKKD